jgi:signal peptidase I
MKRSHLIIIIIMIISMTVLLLNSFLVPIFNKYTLFLFVSLLLLVLIFTVGFTKDKNRYNKDIILTLLMCILFYYVLTYAAGFFVGFSKNIYNLKIYNIVDNIVPAILLIVSTELLRNTINSKIKDKVWILVYSVFIFTLLDTTLIINSVDYTKLSSLLILLGLYVLPGLSKNFLLTYLSYKVGYKSTIVYRLLLEIPLYFVPIIPNFGDYVDSVIYIIVPVFIFSIIRRMFDKTNKGEIILSRPKHTGIIIKTVCVVLVGILVCLNTGFFKYQFIVIATGSMTPSINKGDVVLLKKLNDKEISKLKVGDVLVFKQNNKIIVHRISKIFKSGNEIFFKTKGDNNNDEDNFLTEVNQVLGTTNHKIRYLGYPTIMLYEIMNN